MRADLHVHSYHSGYAKPFGWLRARDSYNSPFEVYRVAKTRGMDLVCLTDHDSIDGGLEFLDRHPDTPDFLLGEEVECRYPDVPDLRIHLGVLGMTERLHRDIQPLRGNVFELAAYLSQQQAFFAVNHLFFFFRDQLPVETYVSRLLAAAPALEAQNGAMLASHNALIGDLAAAIRRDGRTLGLVGGSDAHTLRFVGTTWTETPATTRDGFLADLRAGRSRVGGGHGGAWRMMREVYGSIGNYWRALAGLERHGLTPGQRARGIAWSVALLPFQVPLPAVVAWRMHANEAKRIRAYRDAGLATSPAITAAAPRSTFA